MNYIQLELDLIRDESIRLRVYRCSKGHLTIGVGHKLTQAELTMGLSEISLEQAGKLLHQDIGSALGGCYAIFGREQFDAFPEPRQHALVNMCFQMGQRGLQGFADMVKAVKRGDWAAAYREALDSEWARSDSPKRALRVAKAFKA